MRDILLGFLSYVLAFAAFVSVTVLCHWALAPPIADRARSFAFVGGGGALLLATAIVLAASLVVVAVVNK